MTYGWEKDLAESTQTSETSSGDLAGISFGDSLAFYQKAEQLGNTGRNSTEKRKMAQGQIYIWRCNKTSARKHFSLSFLHHPFPYMQV